MFKGMGGPGSGHIDGLRKHPMNQLDGAMGYGMGAYGYPLVYGITPWGQQAQMLSNQWPSFLPGPIGTEGGGLRIPRWFTFGSGAP